MCNRTYTLGTSCTGYVIHYNIVSLRPNMGAQLLLECAVINWGRSVFFKIVGLVHTIVVYVSYFSSYKFLNLEIVQIL